MSQDIGPPEMAMLKASQKGYRAHDATVFCFAPGGRVVLIRKHTHPPGVFRAPSGGVLPGEDFVTGVLREFREETGLEATLERYLLRIRVTFHCGSEAVPWVSHVFTARTAGGRLLPADTVEIAEATFATLDELQGPIRRALLQAGRGLLAYRVALTDAVVQRLTPPAGLKPHKA